MAQSKLEQIFTWADTCDCWVADAPGRLRTLSVTRDGEEFTVRGSSLLDIGERMYTILLAADVGFGDTPKSPRVDLNEA